MVTTLRKGRRIHPHEPVGKLGGSQTIQYKCGRKKVVWFPEMTLVDNMKLEHMEVQKKVYSLVWELYRSVGVLRARSFTLIHQISSDYQTKNLYRRLVYFRPKPHEGTDAANRPHIGMTKLQTWR